MTDVAQPVAPAELPSPGRDYLPHVDDDPSNGSDEERVAGRGVLRVIGWMTGAAAGVAAIAWFVFLGPGETGSKAEWFFGAVVFVAVLVSLWQTHSILRETRQHAADAAERTRSELAAAAERSERELALVRSIHEAEMDSHRQLARAELAAQVELARVERVHMLAQQQRLAMIGVSRAVGAQIQALASLWNLGAEILRVEDPGERERAMKPVFEQITQVVNDFSVELANAHLLTEDDGLNHAMVRVNEAVLMAMHVAEDVHAAVVDGRPPDPDAVAAAQRLMHQSAAEARHLAWNLLRTGLDDPEGAG
jgi:hypothetical protein